MKKERRSSGCLWVVVILLVLALVVSIVAVIGAISIGSVIKPPMARSMSRGIDEDPNLKEIWARASRQ